LKRLSIERRKKALIQEFELSRLDDELKQIELETEQTLLEIEERISRAESQQVSNNLEHQNVPSSSFGCPVATHLETPGLPFGRNGGNGNQRPRAFEGVPIAASPQVANGNPNVFHLFESPPQAEEIVVSTSTPAEIRHQDRRCSENEVLRNLLEHIKSQDAPEMTLEKFSGDPKQFISFMKRFEDLVETKIVSSSGRLNRLISYCEGRPKNMIMPYVHDADPLRGYESAKYLLRKEYGNPHLLATEYAASIDSYGQVRTSHEFLDFYLFLQGIYISLRNTTAINQIDNPTTIKAVVRKLPQHCQHRWNRQATKKFDLEKEVANFADLLVFIKQESNVANNPMYSMATISDRKDKEKRYPGTDRKSASSPKSGVNKAFASHIDSACVYCGKSGHSLDVCFGLKVEPLEKRIEFLRKQKVCFGCLKPTTGTHYGRTCRNRLKCGSCQKYHPTILHRQHDASPGTESKSKDDSSTIPPETNLKSTATNLGIRCALNAVRVILTSKDSQMEVYCFIDSLANGCFVSESVMQKMKGFQARPEKRVIHTINGGEPTVVYAVSGLSVESMDGKTKVKLPTTYSVQSIPLGHDDIPDHKFIRQWSYLSHLTEDIPEVDSSIPIGLIIGNNVPRVQEPHSVIRGREEGPYALRTILGWIVCGPSLAPEPRLKAFMSKTIAVTESGNSVIVDRSPIDDQLLNKLNAMYRHDFGETGNNFSESSEDVYFRRVMDSGTKVLPSGKYQLPLPIRNPEQPFPDNRDLVLRTTMTLKSRLVNDGKFLQDYTEFMNDMVAKGYSEPVPVTELGGQLGHRFYIPHHGVRHKTKNKLRVVFNCAKVYDQSPSLNSRLITGPAQSLTNNMVGILLRFRKEQYAFMADIESMFYQCEIPEKQRDLLRYFWWKDGDLAEPPIEYRMRVHLFGASSSPAVASYALKRAAEDYASEFSRETCEAVKRDFYVDDLLLSSHKQETIIRIMDESQRLCEKAGFKLTKFVVSHPELIHNIPPERRADVKRTDIELDSAGSEIERVLGVQWDIRNDAIGFKLSMKDRPFTRRGLLSCIAAIHSPMGLLSPFILKGKLILQRLAKSELGWDERLDDDVIEQWLQWRESLYGVERLSLKRCIKSTGFGIAKTTELHVMADASDYAYGISAHLRQINNGGQVSVALIFGKSRLIPVEGSTTPRAELVAAVLAAEYGPEIADQLRYGKIKTYYWTDSSIVIGYLKNQTKRFKQFVSNRIRQIKQSTKMENPFKHVSSSENSADDASRGLDASKVNSEHRWFQGSEFLWDTKFDPDAIEDINTSILDINDGDPELKKHQRCFTTQISPPYGKLSFLLKVAEMKSNWVDILNLIATSIKRYELTASEAECRVRAQSALFRKMQEAHFSREIKLIVQKKPLPRESILHKLDSFVDSSGILRVGGRLNNAEELNDELKHPVIIPRHDKLTDSLVRHLHELVSHCGRNSTLNEMRRQGLWIVHGNRIVRSVLHKCVTCRKTRGKVATQKMASLPEDRSRSVPPFTNVSVDLFGHFVTKTGRKEVKRYCAIFSCLNSRAVHLEMVNDLSTDAFIMALRRFVSRRGPITKLRCDNGTNFVGCRLEMEKCWDEISEEKVKTFLRKSGCDFEWQHNTPVASHMGGVWERMIRTARQILSSILKTHPGQLTDESLRTFITEVEGIMNSRPLTVDTIGDPEGPLPLSPVNLLTMKTKVIMPMPGRFDDNVELYCRKQWRRVQHLAQEFWSRYRKEFLTKLQERSKWNKTQRNLKVDDIVLLKDDSLCRNDWPMARVVDVYTGPDNLVRSVKLRIARNDLRSEPRFLERPVVKLVRLLS
jgi:hypothetical protein